MKYRLGLPAWAFPGWRDRYFVAKPSPLASYASVFNTVEGNTTFYSSPEARTVAAWRSEVEGKDFRFCFKLPRSITHERNPALDELAEFLLAIEPLGDHLGPLLVQFPARVGPNELTAVRRLLQQLPQDLRFVLEVRHPGFFSDPTVLRPMLNEFSCGHVMLDTRALYQGDREHPEVTAAAHEKPDLPVLSEVFNELMFVRLVLHPDGHSNRRFIDEWVCTIAKNVARGVDTYLMIHCPNNLHCPAFALAFHKALISQPGMGGLAPLAPWPVPEQGHLDLS